MSEREKMIAGGLYLASDPALVEERTRHPLALTG
jgi:hypothetical protein